GGLGLGLGAVGLAGAVHGDGAVAQGHAERGDLQDVLDAGGALAGGPFLVVAGAVDQDAAALVQFGDVLGQCAPASGVGAHRPGVFVFAVDVLAAGRDRDAQVAHGLAGGLGEAEVWFGDEVAFCGDRGGHVISSSQLDRFVVVGPGSAGWPVPGLPASG